MKLQNVWIKNFTATEADLQVSVHRGHLEAQIASSAAEKKGIHCNSVNLISREGLATNSREEVTTTTPTKKVIYCGEVAVNSCGQV